VSRVTEILLLRKRHGAAGWKVHGTLDGKIRAAWRGPGLGMALVTADPRLAEEWIRKADQFRRDYAAGVRLS
jgi:hypothetical protein